MTATTIIGYISAAVCIGLFLWVYRGGLKKYAKQLLVLLVERAEASYGSGTGKIKYSAVASKLYELMPKAFKFIFSEKAVSYMIETAVEEMKECIGISGKGDTVGEGA